MDKKLLDLALDLDQTLIHSYEVPLIDKNIKNAKMYENHELYLCKFAENKKMYYVYHRPGLFDFLEKIHKKYNIYIYTYGTRDYAHHIIGYICEKMKCMLFKNIYSREHFTDYKKTLFGESNESNTIIIDDNPYYWDKYLANLIKIDPYYGPFISKNLIKNKIDPYTDPFFYTNIDDELSRISRELDRILTIYEKCEIIDNGDSISTYIEIDSDEEI